MWTNSSLEAAHWILRKWANHKTLTKVLQFHLLYMYFQCKNYAILAQLYPIFFHFLVPFFFSSVLGNFEVRVFLQCPAHCSAENYIAPHYSGVDNFNFLLGYRNGVCTDFTIFLPLLPFLKNLFRRGCKWLRSLVWLEGH